MKISFGWWVAANKFALLTVEFSTVDLRMLVRILCNSWLLCLACLWGLGLGEFGLGELGLGELGLGEFS